MGLTVLIFAIGSTLLGVHTTDNYLHEKHGIQREPVRSYQPSKEKKDLEVFGCKVEKVKPR